MDHFQRTLAARRQILDDRPMMSKLRGHLLEGRKLGEMIGHGTNNIHYRLGGLPGGVWVATREQFREPIPFGDRARTDALAARMRETGSGRTLGFELFCKEAYCWAEEFGGCSSISEFMRSGAASYVSGFSIIVRYKPSWRERPLHAMLVEDLTAGGSISLEAVPEMDWMARVEGTDKRVQIDLDDWPRHVGRHRDVPDYLSEQAVIDL